MKNRMTFSRKMDNHPALKGKQGELPDQIQKEILKSRMKKVSALSELEDAILDTYALTPAIGATSSIISHNKQKKRLKKLGMDDGEIREALQGNALNAAVRGGAISLGTQYLAKRYIPKITTPVGELSHGAAPLVGALASHGYETLRGNRAERRLQQQKVGEIMESKNKTKFTSAYDNHSKLKGKQSKLPDTVQKAIIESSMKKLSALTKQAGHMAVSGGLEGRMAKRQLFEISEMAQELFDQIDDHDDLQEWCQVKIATIHDRLHSVHSYMAYNNRFPKKHPKGCGCNDCGGTTKLAGVKKKFQNPEGGLNAKGRAYFKRTQGSNLKRPVSARQASNSPKAASRRRSFCARMGGMRAKHAIDCRANPDKSICKALRKWDC